MRARLFLCLAVFYGTSAAAQASKTTGKTVCTEPVPGIVECVQKATTTPACAEGVFACVAKASEDRKARDARRQEQADAADARMRRTRIATAQWDAFRPRAVMVMQRGVDSVGFGGGKADSLLWSEQVTALMTLFEIAPLATTQQMHEAVEPIVNEYLRRRDAFDRRAVAIIRRVSDSLRLSGVREDSFWARLSAPLMRARRDNWLMPDNLMRALIDSVVTSALAKDSTGAPKKPPA